MARAPVLIVDDSLTVRMDLSRSFEDAGFRVVACSTVAEALAAIARGSFALAVLDVMLPDGDGIELLRALRATPSSPPILMLSGAAEVTDRTRGMAAGADDYIGKPYDIEHMLSLARALMREPSAEVRPLVLIIDDSATFRDALRVALETAGYVVQAAASGEEGLRALAHLRPAAVIVDGLMQGIDGATVIRHIRLDEALRGTPCLLLTGAEERGAELHALDAGADGFARKEEGFEAVLARLVAVLRSAVHPRKETESLLGQKRVLAVNDGATYLAQLVDVLRLDGYDVVPARSEEEAIEMLAIQPIDCILLDVLMPGLSGTHACARIKASPVVREIPLIMISAREDRAAMLEGLSAGADDYIVKSSGFDVIRARVRAQLRRKQFEDEHRRVRDALLRSELEASDAHAARRVAEVRAELVDELERKNRELETFSYSVSHDLRAPLRAIDGFSQILEMSLGPTLDAQSREHLALVRSATARMGALIDDLLKLSQVGRSPIARVETNLSEIASEILDDLQRIDPDRHVASAVRADMRVSADPGLLRALLENLLANAWKFTSGRPEAHIEVGMMDGGVPEYFVQDDGAGFDMQYASKLFTPFQRLHSGNEFSGTGIGLATARRIVERHGGRIWAEGEVNHGATIHFSLLACPTAQA